MESTDLFIQRFGQDLYEELFECCWNNTNTDQIFIEDKVMQNAANWDFYGHIVINGVTTYFSASCGDWNGSVINSFGVNPQTPKEITITEYAFELNEELKDKELSKKKFDLLSQEGNMIHEMTRKMNYDMRVSPTLKVKEHYKSWADSKGLVITTKTVVLR